MLRHFVCLMAGSVVLLFLGMVPCHAVREATANANFLIRNYERKGEFGKAAVWQEAAARAFEVITAPMTQTVLDYCESSSKAEQARQLKEELRLIKTQQQEYLTRAQLNWKKAKEKSEELDAERARVEEYFLVWISHYPNAFYQFGFYNNLFKRGIGSARDQRKYGDALRLEAAAAELCARQYEVVVLGYLKDELERKKADADWSRRLQEQVQAYERIRQAQLSRAAQLRSLAAQPLSQWPPEIDRKQIAPPETPRKFTTDQAIAAARSDRRIQEFRAGQPGVREWAVFQGSYWQVNYGNRIVAFVDDATGKVMDVVVSPGNVEDHTPRGR